MTKESLKETFKILSQLCGVVGNEQIVSKTISEMISPYCDEVKISTIGNVVAVKKGNKPGKALWLDAHMDEVGFCVKNILPDGFLRVEKLGNVADILCVGRKVWVGNKKIPGVFGIKPAHVMTTEDQKKVPSIETAFVDVGASSEEEAKKMGIRIGDSVTIQNDFMEMYNPDLIATKAIDDRINCSILVELFRNLKPEDFGGTVYAAFSVKEERGRNGANAAIFNYDVDYALALDTIPTCDAPGLNARDSVPIFLGKGPAMSIYESLPYDGFHFIHPAVRKIIEDAAEELEIPLQEVVFPGYATNATRLSNTKNGIPTGTLAVPRRYSHSPVEIVNLNDALASLKILKKIVEKNEKAEISFIE